MVRAGVKCSYLEGTNESLCNGILGVDHLYLHHLVKHLIRMLLKVVVQHLVYVSGEHGKVGGGGGGGGGVKRGREETD